MQFTSIATFLFLAVYAAAVDVACLVNGVSVAVVDSETGVCPFAVPEDLPVAFNFVSAEDYDATFYYATVDAVKYFTDILNAGRIIEIPANLLFQRAAAALFQVDLHRHDSNSTEAIRRRLLKQVEIQKRAPVDDFIAFAKEQEGTAVPGAPIEFSVVLASDLSSSAVPTVTSTNIHTTTEVITTCEDNKCGVTSVPVKPTVTTETVNGVTTVYTTYCPETTVITITSCADNKCHEKTVPASHIKTKGTIHGKETVYYTVCPITESTKVVTTPCDVTSTVSYTTVTVCPDVCHTTSKPVITVIPSSTVITVTTWVPITVAPTGAPTVAPTAAPTTVAPQTKAPVAPTTAAPSTVAPIAISTYAGAGAKVGFSLAAVLPVLGFMI